MRSEITLLKLLLHLPGTSELMQLYHQSLDDSVCIVFMFVLLAFWQSDAYPSASEVTLKDMGKIALWLAITKHTSTLFIGTFLGSFSIYYVVTLSGHFICHYWIYRVCSSNYFWEIPNPKLEKSTPACLRFSLGTTFILMLINDITQNITCSIRVFADDTTLLIDFHNEVDGADVINNDLVKIYTWTNKWLYHLVHQRLSPCFFHRGTGVYNPTPLYTLMVLLSKKCTRSSILTTLTSNLSWYIRVENMANKAAKEADIMAYLQYCPDHSSFETIYRPFIHPILDYVDGKKSTLYGSESCATTQNRVMFGYVQLYKKEHDDLHTLSATCMFMRRWNCSQLVWIIFFFQSHIRNGLQCKIVATIIFEDWIALKVMVCAFASYFVHGGSVKGQTKKTIGSLMKEISKLLFI